ncbi:protein-export chaperone SecB [Staphylococcus epidermidis]|uniref:protein-export chaperone SecB n=1 Tax=Staphylococcus epidermidis TaxID=1282 RepID=UPI00254FD2CE|nr:protein-export chaperone SecB [Staphylococcus epidermidis]MDK7902793.1 protein-export chaperone SecB [Staphylococcus epidermidis]MDK8779913.1 protein-export chaperone SecB [Staphylococcus epidermidis]WJD66089.1 protein-export chaperone SecB [Staphylococcus epidermidis]
MASLIFKDYIVDKMYFKANPNYKEEENGITINPDISVEISNDNEIAIVKIDADINEDLDNPVYQVSVTIIGVFEFNQKEADEIKFDELLSSNAIAILYPYLRSLVSELTNKSNNYPNFNLPVMNIVQMLKDNDKIKFVN